MTCEQNVGSVLDENEYGVHYFLKDAESLHPEMVGHVDFGKRNPDGTFVLWQLEIPHRIINRLNRAKRKYCMDDFGYLYPIKNVRLYYTGWTCWHQIGTDDQGNLLFNQATPTDVYFDHWIGGVLTHDTSTMVDWKAIIKDEYSKIDSLPHRLPKINWAGEESGESETVWILK